MKKIWKGIFLCYITSSLATGCATICRNDIQGEGVRTVYPASITDIYLFSMSFQKYDFLITSHNDPLALRITERAIVIPISIIDLPISLITDTILLPYDIWRIQTEKHSNNEVNRIQ
ncbi:MAG: YceK/YidQ family lipoprotein [Victivallales bacterium]|nr:YceK/YidQ family lipoprotein [Victivallales bacterium]